MGPLSKRITVLLLRIYAIANRAGLLRLTFVSRVFNRTYFLYKRLLEDPYFSLTKRHPELFAEGDILDIGANIGYTTVVLSNVVQPRFFVYAFEPEAGNFALLEKNVAGGGARNPVVGVRAAVGERDGSVELWINDAHHADHRIVTAAFRDALDREARFMTVPLVSIDSYLAKRGTKQPVSFVKIDVQGYELPVCRGMVKTLEENPNAVVAFEYSPDSSSALGLSASDLLEFFTSRGYGLYLLDRKGRVRFVSGEDISRETAMKGYLDLIASKLPIRRD